jgi:uncharacterized protein YyaL (SSP411 family)
LRGEARAMLRAARARRPPPARDEKVIAAWNGLMVSAFARAAFVLGDDRYAQVASRAVDFALDRMREGARLAHAWTAGHLAGPAFLDDYAFLVAALLDLYEVTSDPVRLTQAIALDEALRADFEDTSAGGYFLTPPNTEGLLAREKPADDGVQPSGNSVEALNLLRLYALTERDEYRARAERTLRAFEERFTRAPTAMPDMLCAVDFATDRAKEVVLVAPASTAELAPFASKLRAIFVPNRVLVRTAGTADASKQAAVSPLAQDKTVREGKATAYVCEGGSCKLPTTDPEQFARQLREVVSFGK